MSRKNVVAVVESVEVSQVVEQVEPSIEELQAAVDSANARIKELRGAFRARLVAAAREEYKAAMKAIKNGESQENPE